jgi:transposase
MPPRTPAIELTGEERRTLAGWAEGGNAVLAVRARLILLVADGLRPAEASRRLGLTVTTTSYWLRLVRDGGPRALVSRRSRPGRIEAAMERRPELERLAAGGDTRLAAVVKALIAVADGHGVIEAARLAGIGPHLVSRSLRRLMEAGPEALSGDPSLGGGARAMTVKVKLDGGQRAALERWAGGGGEGVAQAARMSRRARIILMADDGVGVYESARRTGVCPSTVADLRRRFVREGLRALWNRRSEGRGPGPFGEADLAALAGWAEGRGAGPRLAAAAKAILLVAEGWSVPAAARSSGLGGGTLGAWLKRFSAAGPEALLGLKDPVRSGPSSRLAPIALDGAQRGVLEGWARGGGGRPGLDKRAKVILLDAEGVAPSEMARRAGLSRAAAHFWRKMFLAGGLEALSQAHPYRRRGAPPAQRRAGFELAGGDRGELESWVRKSGAAPAIAKRAKMILSGAEGTELAETARRLGTSRGAVSFWWRRFSSLGLDGLRGARAGGEVLEAEIAALLEEPPPGLRKRWTAESMARVLSLTNAEARAVMVKLGALPERRLTAASFDPGWVARRVAALAASPPPEPFRRWNIEAVARVLDVTYRQARQGLIEAGCWPPRSGRPAGRPGDRPPDGGGGSGGGPPDGDGGA